MRKFIDDQIALFGQLIQKTGGEWETPIIAEPATENELNYIESLLGSSLPATLRDFALTVSKRIYFSWELPDEFPLPNDFREIFCGGFDYDITKIPEHEEGRKGWLDTCFPNSDDAYDLVWHDKTAFHHIPNGDYLGLNRDGEAVYLSHDGGDGHGYVMADSISDLLQRWLPLGCPGAEDWQWLPFYCDTTKRIDPNSKLAKDWLRLLSTKP